MTRRRLAITSTLVVALAGTASATGDAAAGGGGGSITFWTTLVEPDRVATQERIIEAFTEASGIEVELVPVPEDDLPNLIVTNAASGDLPDVVHHPIDFSIGWAEQGILDVEAAAAVIESLGADTFNQGALALASQDGQPVAVPADGWGQLLVYRTDLFEGAGLEPPDTFANLLAAAEALHGDGMSGITASTDPADVFTQQTFEFLALGAGCQLIQDGEIALDSPACVEAIATYADLIQNYSPGTVQNVDTTRSTYFAGDAAMLIWSPFILDELAGLRNDALPTCDECADDPMFLVNNSGFVPALSAEGTEPAQYGQVSYFGIGTGADTDSAQQFVEFLMSDGYVDWLSIAPEGMFPMRAGTADAPDSFVEGWKGLEIGVDTRMPFGEVYTDDVVATLIDGTNNFQRWGFADGFGALVSSLYTSLTIPQTLSAVLNEGLSPEEAAAQMHAEAEEQLEEVGGG
jgi:multiple sugar transport system substrate-binding protein